MENLVNQALEQITTYVSWPYLLTFMLLTYFVKVSFETALEAITKLRWKTAYTVLIIGTVLAVPFLFFTAEGWMKILVTYAVGTSLHELLGKAIEKKIKAE